MLGFESSLKCVPDLPYGEVIVLAGDEYSSLLKFASLLYGYDAQIRQEVDVAICGLAQSRLQIFNTAVQNTYFWLTDPDEARKNVHNLSEYQEELHYRIHRNERISEAVYWKEFPTKFQQAHLIITFGSVFKSQTIQEVFPRIQKYAADTTTAVVLCGLEKDIQDWKCPVHVVHFDMTAKTVCYTKQGSLDKTPIKQLSWNGLILREK